MKKAVLVIDDNEELAALLMSHFTDLGFSAFTAPEGKTGVEMALKLNPDVITMDFSMPGANGAEVYRELRRHPQTATIPVVFFSSIVTGLIRRMVPESPLVRFMKKPCPITEIGEAVSELAALPRLSPPPPPPGAAGRNSPDGD